MNTFMNLPRAKRSDKTVTQIQETLKKNGIKMSAIEIRELMRANILSPDESKIMEYVRKLRTGH
jgi:hypothetical protein